MVAYRPTISAWLSNYFGGCPESEHEGWNTPYIYRMELFMEYRGEDTPITTVYAQDWDLHENDAGGQTLSLRFEGNILLFQIDILHDLTCTDFLKENYELVHGTWVQIEDDEEEVE